MSKVRTVTRYIFFIVSAAAILMMAACVVVGIVVYRARPERRAAAVFGQDSGTGYGHVAVYARGARASGAGSPLSYLDDGTSLSSSDIDSIRVALDGVVNTTSGSKKSNAKKVTYNWTDCYSSCFKGTVNSGAAGTGNTYEADIYAVSGSFTVMHPVEFMSGGFLSSDTTDRYQVVLNDAIAWNIFSSYDVVGKRISLLSKDYTIIGVVREHEDKKPRVYISFEALKEYCSGLDDPVIPAVMCYEAMIPEQVSGSARLDVCGALPGYNISSPAFRVVRVTGRYNVFNTFKADSAYGYELPFWEEGAMRAESDIKTAAVVFLFGLVMVTGIAIGKVSSIADPGQEE
ncbi:MAG: ABC transporter permease [Clostridiales bacterium]|nr:ABC transporter permease [Clostridiales bacterium]